MTLFKKRITPLNRLRGCVGWFAPWLFAHLEDMFAHNKADLKLLFNLFFNLPGGPSTPNFAATPLTLVANTNMLSDERLTCEGNIGYPHPVGRLLFQVDSGPVAGIFDEFTITSSILNQSNTTKDCQTIATYEVGLLYFDLGWNNTKIRCAIEDQDGNIKLVSEEFTMQLLESK